MTIDVFCADRIAMSQKERDVLKIMHAVLNGERTQADAAHLIPGELVLGEVFGDAFHPALDDGGRSVLRGGGALVELGRYRGPVLPHRADLGRGETTVESHAVPALIEAVAAAHHVRLETMAAEVIRASADAAQEVLTRKCRARCNRRP